MAALVLALAQAAKANAAAQAQWNQETILAAVPPAARRIGESPASRASCTSAPAPRYFSQRGPTRPLVRLADRADSPGVLCLRAVEPDSTGEHAQTYSTPDAWIAALHSLLAKAQQKAPHQLDLRDVPQDSARPYVKT
jgi:hypothetical protein